MRHLDHTINITWVMQHLNVAIKYIDHSGLGNGQPAVVIGKIHAQKYRSEYFPDLWSGRNCKLGNRTK
jgi:tryptophan 2,3-dioxygenase